MKELKIDFTRINNDVNGNPRYVCHFLELTTVNDSGLSIDQKYRAALKRARTIGGGKFHNKQYGGGIVFQSYNLHSTEARIFEVLRAEAPLIGDLLPKVKANKHTYYNLDASAKNEFKDAYNGLKKYKDVEVNKTTLAAFNGTLNRDEMEYLNKLQAINILRRFAV